MDSIQLRVRHIYIIIIIYIILLYIIMKSYYYFYTNMSVCTHEWECKWYRKKGRSERDIERKSVHEWIAQSVCVTETSENVREKER